MNGKDIPSEFSLLLIIYSKVEDKFIKKSESKDGRYLSQEEFISLLSTHCSFFDYKGLSLPVRQMIKRLSKLFSCQTISEHHSPSRRDLSL